MSVGKHPDEDMVVAHQHRHFPKVQLFQTLVVPEVEAEFLQVNLQRQPSFLHKLFHRVNGKRLRGQLISKHAVAQHDMDALDGELMLLSLERKLFPKNILDERDVL